MPNRLAAERSPYLRQHMNNPVDWMPWGDEAFVRAESERKPIFLSVGYASCHWCHVMERECFEDEEIAVLLNRNFVSVKVDREELPEVDEAYMLAVQLTSGHGGWPASVFLTPDGKPFFGGTYFPKEDRGRAAGFRTVLTRLSAEWGRDPKAIQAAGEELAVALAQVRGRQSPGTFATFDEALVERCVQTLLAGFDTTNGGFGAAPKFPPHAAIGLLFELAASEVGSEELRSKGLAAAILTLDKMARGGIHDHVGGGFHRYSTDARWHLPHFEK
ncbi:MAG: thioredoxin domain-containing protein, partial [Fimbriimonas ginsengisoli]|nr:thioredoxin domain-containing protein [Fimbriimonas ginsengisoli]